MRRARDPLGPVGGLAALSDGAACGGGPDVADVGRARATLEARGVEFHGETFDTGVCHMAFFDDSEGNDLMLHSRYALRVTEG